MGLSQASSHRRRKSLTLIKVHDKKTSPQVFYDQFKISDRDGADLDLSDVLKVDLKNDSVQSFDQRWEETNHRDVMEKRHGCATLVVSTTLFSFLKKEACSDSTSST